MPTVGHLCKFTAMPNTGWALLLLFVNTISVFCVTAVGIHKQQPSAGKRQIERVSEKINSFLVSIADANYF